MTLPIMPGVAIRCCWVIEESSCRLDYQLHTANGEERSFRLGADSPGGLVFFDGDALRHRITPLGEGETRVSLTFEYLTDRACTAGGASCQI